MSDPPAGVNVSGGQLQGIVGAGSVVIENLTFYGRPPDTVEQPAGAEPIGPCPYPGLAYFGPNDADLFFGRDAAIARLTEAVGRQSFTGLMGASGSGKSSVVLAGLAPRLNAAGNWRFSHFRIGTELERNPFLALARAVAPLYVTSDSDVERLKNTKLLASSLAAGELTLRDVFADCRSRNKGRRILLIADQFEEAFTLVDDEAVRTRFIDVLLGGFPDPAAGEVPDICLILTMRADFYGRALHHRPLADALQNHVENLGPMKREELQAAIARPAEKAGVRFDAGLVETLLDAVQSKPGGLPLLQFALREMWSRQERKTITRKSYDEIGGVEGALAQRAETVFGALTKGGGDPAMDKAFQRLFTRLVTLGQGQEDTRRVVERAELGDEVWGLAQRLAGEENRLVVTNASSARETAEVVHEALIRHWPKLVDWINRDRAFQSWLRQIAGGIELWSANPDDDGPLLRGGMLAQAAEWLARRRDDLSAKELAYIEASVALRRRIEEEKDAARQAEIKRQQELAEAAQKLADEQRRRTRVATVALAGTAAAFVIAIGLAYFAYKQSGELRATNQALIERTQALVEKTNQAVKAQGDAVAATTEAQQANKLAQAATRLAKARLLASEARLALTGDGGAASVERSLLLATASLSSSWTQEGFEAWARAIRLSLPRSTVVLGAEAGPFAHVTFSSDGSLLAVAGKEAIFLINARTLQTVGTLPRRAATLAFSPDGTLLASGIGATVAIWRVIDRSLVTELPDARFEVESIAFDAAGQRLAFGGKNYYGRIFETSGWTEIARRWSQSVEAAHASARSVAFSPEGQWLVAHGSRLIAWSLVGAFEPEPAPDVVSGKVKSVTVSEAERVPSFLTFTRDSSRLVASSGIWRVSTLGPPFYVDFVAKDKVTVGSEAIAASSANAEFVATSNLAIWQPDTGEEVARVALAGPSSQRPAVALSPDGRWLVAGGDRLERWDTGTGGVAMYLQHDKAVLGVAASRNGRHVVTVSADGVAHVWQTGASSGALGGAAPWSKLRELEISKPADDEGRGNALFNPDDRWLVVSRGNILKIFETDGWRELARIESKRRIESVAFTRDGRFILMRESDQEGQDIGVIATGSWQRSTIPGIAEFGLDLPAISISPDGQWLAGKVEATCGARRPRQRVFFPGRVRVWQVADGKQVAALPLGIDTVTDKDRCPTDDQQDIGAPSGNTQLAKEARGWVTSPMTSRADVYEGSFETGDLNAVPWVAKKGSYSNTIDLTYDDGRPVTLRQPAWLSDMAVAGNGRWLVTAGGDGKARVWALRPQDMIAASCERLTANLSEQDWRAYHGSEAYVPICPNLPRRKD